MVLHQKFCNYLYIPTVVYNINLAYKAHPAPADMKSWIAQYMKLFTH